MLTIDNIKRIEGQVVRIKGLDWKIIGATDMADGKSQYQFYLNHGSNFRTIYLDRKWVSKTNLKGMLYKLHTSANGVFVSNEELRSVGSTMYWLERVCE
jgi:hypothetical protein